jgi:hypothetical protein
VEAAPTTAKANHFIAVAVSLLHSFHLKTFSYCYSIRDNALCLSLIVVKKWKALMMMLSSPR